MESALAAAVVTEAAAAATTTGETAAQVGEAAAAAADEEEGEAAAAAKGKRTALRGLGGLPSRAPRALPWVGNRLCLAREALVGRPRLRPRSARVLPAVARRREAPQVLQGEWGRGAWGLARAPGRRGRGTGPALEPSAGESRGWGCLAPGPPPGL